MSCHTNQRPDQVSGPQHRGGDEQLDDRLLVTRQSMVVDEAQSLTPQEVKTIVTQVGQGTKIVLRDGRREHRPAS